jgi:hypothetical protein
MNIKIASSIKDDSWLNDEKYKDFRAAWGYASTQTRSIPAMSAITPEQGFFLFEALKRGEQLYGTDGPS